MRLVYLIRTVQRAIYFARILMCTLLGLFSKLLRYCSAFEATLLFASSNFWPLHAEIRRFYYGRDTLTRLCRFGSRTRHHRPSIKVQRSTVTRHGVVQIFRTVACEYLIPVWLTETKVDRNRMTGGNVENPSCYLSGETIFGESRVGRTSYTSGRY